MNADPLFGNTLDGEDSEWLYHYELALAKLLTTIVKDEDAAYVVAGATRRIRSVPAQQLSLPCQTHTSMIHWIIFRPSRRSYTVPSSPATP